MVATRFFTSNNTALSIVKQLRNLARGVAVLGIASGMLGQTAFGQFGGFGQTGGMGQSGFGQMGMGQTGGMSQMGGIGQLGMGQTGMGQMGGAGQMGQFGGGQNGQAGANGAAANPFGSGGMLGGANSFGGLAGAALMNRGMQNSMGGMGMGGMGMGMGGMGGRGARGGMNSQSQNQSSNKPKIRASVKLGFEVAAPSNAATTRLVNDRISRTPSPIFDNVTVVMEGRTAVIRGEVDSPASAKTIERYLSLEPGIDAVKNELTLANGAGSATATRNAVPANPQAPGLNPSTPSASSSSRSTPSAEIVPAPGPGL